MLFFIHCIDKPDSQELRAENRRHHLEHLSLFKKNIVCAGPTLSEDGEGMTGSVMLVDFPDRSAVEGFMHRDPYTRAQLFQSVRVERWKKVIPASA
ncbi:MAG: YciI family protein [Hyphomicrobiales bacterium]|nr:YciI family protein [Hyphomicrobiales bacterium]MCP5370418.1 YciI family protein [Hyphomicrobiales bacterium]